MYVLMKIHAMGLISESGKADLIWGVRPLFYHKFVAKNMEISRS